MVKFVNCEFNEGQRVQACPSTDTWMKGDRYGTVSKITRQGIIHVAMDRSGKTIRFDPSRLLPVQW